MKNKHPHAAVVLVLGLAMAGLHLADLLLWSEADTGFAAAGSVWLRYIPWLAAFALPYLPARRAAAMAPAAMRSEAANTASTSCSTAKAAAPATRRSRTSTST